MAKGLTLVLGAGNFGTALAHHLAHKGRPTLIWAREKEVSDSINTHHRNPFYLQDVELSRDLKAYTNMDDIPWADVSHLVLAIPAQFMRGVLRQARAKLSQQVILICAAKGIELDSLKMPITIVSEECSQILKENIVVLSGPSFAIEVAKHQPTAVSVACSSQETASKVQELFHAEYFRAYTSDDPIGLEVAGALKNVVALAAGAVAGMGLSNNTQAALLTRGLAEITRIGVSLGAKAITFNGLGGVGDLFLTCTSVKSRNYRVGYALGQGKKLDDVIASLGSIAEGVTTSKSAYELTQKLGVDAPIIQIVYKVLYCGLSVQEAVSALLAREMKPEIT